MVYGSIVPPRADLKERKKKKGAKESAADNRFTIPQGIIHYPQDSPSTLNTDNGLPGAGDGNIGNAAGLREIDGNPGDEPEPHSGRKGSHPLDFWVFLGCRGCRGRSSSLLVGGSRVG